MAVASIATGTQTCVIGTEHTLNAPTGGKTYVLYLDLTALVALDLIEIRIYNKTLSSSALSALDIPTVVAGPPAGAAFMSIPIPSVHGCSFTIKQVAGTGRAVPWTVATLD